MEERYIHANDPLESLYVPKGFKWDYFDPEQWVFSKLVPDDKNKAYMKLQAKHKNPDYSKIQPFWLASEGDIENYGFGSEEVWCAYVQQSFCNTLAAKKEKLKRQMAKHLNLSLKNESSKYYGKIN